MPQLHVRETTLTWKMPEHIGDFTLRGVSRSTEATSYYIPELGWCIDAGTAVNTTRPENIFITHSHNDHTLALPRLKSRRKPPTITAPEQATDLIEAYIDAAQRLTSGVPLPDDFRWTRSYDLVGVRPGVRLPLRRGYVVDVIGCDHSIPCVGYIFSTQRNKLKPEYQDLPGPELGALRQSGVEIAEAVTTPLMAFLGDTTPRVYEMHPELLDCKLIVGECTFLTPEHRDGAWKRKHTHWADLRPIIADNPQTHFVLTHFSLRYTTDQIRAFFDEADTPDNITPWVCAGDVR